MITADDSAIHTGMTPAADTDDFARPLLVAADAGEGSGDGGAGDWRSSISRLLTSDMATGRKGEEEKGYFKKEIRRK
jgi:hypothetical protein